MEEFVPLDTLAPPAWVARNVCARLAPGCLPPCAGNRLVHPGRPPLCSAAWTWCCRSFAWTGRWPRLAEHCQLGVRQFERQFCAPMAKACASFVKWRCSQLLASQVFGMSSASKPRPWPISRWMARILIKPTSAATCVGLPATARRNWPASWPSRIRRCGPTVSTTAWMPGGCWGWKAPRTKLGKGVIADHPRLMR